MPIINVFTFNELMFFMKNECVRGQNKCPQWTVIF